MTSLPTIPLKSDDIDFLPLSPNEWRVSDTRFPAESIDALLGFVAREDGLYYATRMNHPLEAVPFDTLDLVAEYFATAPA